MTPAPRLLRRISLSTGIVTKSIPANAVSSGSSPGGLQLPVIDPTQGLKIVAGFAQVSDQANSQKLTVVGCVAGLWLSGSGGVDQLNVRAYQPQSNANVAGFFLATTGIRWSWYDPDMLHGADYKELSFVGITPGSFNLETNIDISNSDAAPHNVTFILSALVELYQLDVLGSTEG